MDIRDIGPNRIGQEPGEAPGDFVIQGPAATGHKGYAALCGIDSPGLTASLAIADYVAELAISGSHPPRHQPN